MSDLSVITMCICALSILMSIYSIYMSTPFYKRFSKKWRSLAQDWLAHITKIEEHIEWCKEHGLHENIDEYKNDLSNAIENYREAGGRER